MEKPRNTWIRRCKTWPEQKDSVQIIFCWVKYGYNSDVLEIYYRYWGTTVLTYWGTTVLTPSTENTASTESIRSIDSTDINGTSDNSTELLSVLRLTVLSVFTVLGALRTQICTPMTLVQHNQNEPLSYIR